MTALWDLYHLAGNPFFQEPLGSETATQLPAIDKLFVGRQAELDLAWRLTTHDHATRTVIVGGAGVGKTTFLHRLLEQLGREHDAHGHLCYITHTPAIRVQSRWQAMDLCAEVLRTLLLMRAVRRPRTVTKQVWQSLRGMVGRITSATTFWDRITQIVEGRALLGMGVQGGTASGQLGVTTQTGWAPPVLQPPSMLLITEDACRVAAAEFGADLVFVLNNLENLSHDDAHHAAGLLQDVRDLFLAPRTHWIVCGTPDIATQVIGASIQVQGIFPSPVTLNPLTPAEIAELLQRRYTALQRGTTPVDPPVNPRAGATLAHMYHGDLRNFLRLLQDATLRGAGIGPRTALEPQQILRLMGHEHIAAIEEALSATSWHYLRRTVLGDTSSAPIWATFRQVDAADRCALSAQALKRHIAQWRNAALVEFDRYEGRSEWWRLTGAAAVGLAALALDEGRDITPLLHGTGRPDATPDRDV